MGCSEGDGDDGAGGVAVGVGDAAHHQPLHIVCDANGDVEEADDAREGAPCPLVAVDPVEWRPRQGSWHYYRWRCGRLGRQD